MFVPTLPTEELVNENAENKTLDVSKPWKNFFEQQQSNMQMCLGEEGFWIPSVSSDDNSVTPSAPGGQLAQVAASFGKQGGVSAGVLVFDPYEVNNGTLEHPMGQLKVLLNDGTFHSIVNT